MERADSILREALHLGTKLLADEPSHLSDIHNDLGVLHLQAGNRKQAESDFKTALMLVEKVEKENDGRKAVILANVLAAQGKYAEAGSLFTEAAKTQERVLGRVPEGAATLGSGSL